MLFTGGIESSGLEDAVVFAEQALDESLAQFTSPDTQCRPRTRLTSSRLHWLIQRGDYAPRLRAAAFPGISTPLGFRVGEKLHHAAACLAARHLIAEFEHRPFMAALRARTTDPRFSQTLQIAERDPLQIGHHHAQDAAGLQDAKTFQQ